MSIGTATKGRDLPEELLPLKVPYVVREAWGFIALSIILFIPIAGLIFVVISRINAYLASDASNKVAQVHPAITVLLLALAFAIFFAGPFWLVGSKTSRFILATIREHVNSGRLEEAEKIALWVDYQVWSRDFRQNEWFQQFLQQRGIYEKSAKYRKLLKQLH